MAKIKTVGELLDFLATQPRDRQVIVLGDRYSPIAEADESMYVARSGTVYPTDEQINDGAWTEEDRAPKSAKRVIVLYSEF